MHAARSITADHTVAELEAAQLVNVEEFVCPAEARVLIGDCQQDYNQRRPCSSLGMRTPAAFATNWTADTAPA